MGKYPKNYDYKNFDNNFVNASIDNMNATNSLIMNDYFLTGKSICDSRFFDWQVQDAKREVDENHK